MNKLFACLVLLTCTGCVSGKNLVKALNELEDNPAIVSIKINTIYGSVVMSRVGSNTNSVSVSPDGTITVNPSR